MRKQFLLCLNVALFTAFVLSVRAQDKSVNALDTLPSAVEALQSHAASMSKLKISGYIQTQWQKADTFGSPTDMAGGNMPSMSDNRFMVRRGRVKFAYTNELSNYVLQFDVTEKGLGIKDAYVNFTDPWTKYLTVTGGVFNRPFGFEIEYSSSSRETPERSRIFQTLFKDERDCGAKLTIQAPKGHPLNFLRIDGGFFNGNAMSTETDKYKDFIGHLSAKKTLMNESLSLSGGVSYYSGAIAIPTTHPYIWKDGKFQTDNSKWKGMAAKREYLGFDAQASLQSAIGITTLRGEYISGTQPGTSGSSQSPNSATYYVASQTYTTTAKTVDDVITYTTKADAAAYNDIYLRSFSGGYINLVQSIGQTKHELVAKYDWYDPNTKVAGNDIYKDATYDKTAKKLDNPGKTTTADLKYTTIGLGWIYHWNSNVKITAYYDMVSNEPTNNAGIKQSLVADKKYNGIGRVDKDRKDNVITVRVQYKF